MPELPEVENVVKSILKNIKGSKIIKMYILWSKLIRNIDKEEFIKIVTNKNINNVWRKGKYIIFDIETHRLVCHLRMEGKWFFLKNGKIDEYKHSTAVFIFDNGCTGYFVDTRKFGTFDLVKKDDLKLIAGIAKLGTDANDININEKEVFVKISKTSRPIKTVLLDQTVIAGIGNIYADEILFKSNIHPLKKGKSFSQELVTRIIKNSKVILDLAISYGGSTVKTFEISHGNSGNFAQFLNVYQRQNKPCTVCEGVIKRIVISGRGTHFCESCQHY
ncbi:DNA-formamidopyrimidine glycosylase [Spiroplasma endosymbiont of Aspidapion aeneum]|uniref:DNA-formamidopyrimidine glycosylase n=1 Tax=Spiroplasma endosymbiont of Aspidapion aeneum TaxID=3066276 RepID=UPI00313C37F3